MSWFVFIFTQIRYYNQDIETCCVEEYRAVFTLEHDSVLSKLNCKVLSEALFEMTSPADMEPYLYNFFYLANNRLRFLKIKRSANTFLIGT